MMRAIAARSSPSSFLWRARRSACPCSESSASEGLRFLRRGTAADDAIDQRTVRMHGGGLVKKGLEIVFLFDLLLQSGLVIAREPTNDLVDFFLRTVLAFRFFSGMYSGYTFANAVAKIRCPGIVIPSRVGRYARLGACDPCRRLFRNRLEREALRVPFLAQKADNTASSCKRLLISNILRQIATTVPGSA